MLSLTVNAESLDELKKKLAGLEHGATLAATATEDLVEELRRRMRPQGYVVNIDPVPALESGEAVAAASPPKRGRPAKDKTTATEPSATTMVPEKSENSVTEPAASTVQNTTGDPEQPEQPPQSAETVEPVTGPLDAPSASVAGGASVSAPTRDEVIAALNAYAAPRGGQVAGRTKMQEVCGVARLQDIKPEDYTKLVTALKAAA